LGNLLFQIRFVGLGLFIGLTFNSLLTYFLNLREGLENWQGEIKEGNNLGKA